MVSDEPISLSQKSGLAKPANISMTDSTTVAVMALPMARSALGMLPAPINLEITDAPPIPVKSPIPIDNS